MMATKDFLNKLVQTCPDGIIGVNRAGTVIIFNPAAEKLTGLACDNVMGRMSIQDVYDAPDMAREIKKKIYGNSHGGAGRLEGLDVWVKGARGRRVPIRLSAALIVDNQVEVGSVGFFHDLTSRKKMEEELRRRSITDSLTGLYNRRHFHATLSAEITRYTRYGGTLSLAIFDLDHFKAYNDTYGHQEGDNILRFAAECMSAVFRSTDHMFRIGGDEFAVLLVETELSDAGHVMERFRSLFAVEWSQKMGYLGEHLRSVTVSIGVAQLAPTEKADKFQLRADLAMYEAKNAGGGRTVLAAEKIGNNRHTHPKRQE